LNNYGICLIILLAVEYRCPSFFLWELGNVGTASFEDKIDKTRSSVCNVGLELRTLRSRVRCSAD